MPRLASRSLIAVWSAALICSVLVMGSTSAEAASPASAPLSATHPEAVPAAKSDINFELDVMPILTVAGCNGGPCHGKSRGQNGFQLSLLGFDADFDFNAIVKQARGRRVQPSAPEQSLLLLKAAGIVPHGGGVKLAPDGESYAMLKRRWIALGMPRTKATDPKLVGIEVTPRDRILPAKSREQLKVTAKYSDGSQRDVTRLTAYQSNESAVAAIDTAGLVTAGALPGETAIMARYMNNIAVFNVAVPLAGKVDKDIYASLPRRNFIDDLVWKRLERLGIVPSEGCDDATFLRRVHLDVIGVLPTPDEARKFLADTSPDKRAKLVDALLARPEYADHWANKWADLLRPNPYRVGIKATVVYDQWIRDAFRTNKPYDRFVADLVASRGKHVPQRRDGSVPRSPIAGRSDDDGLSVVSRRTPRLRPLPSPSV